MQLLRSERFAAGLLLGAAALALVLANGPLGDALAAIRDQDLGPESLGLRLSAGHWVTDGLLAVFFFVAAIELRSELSHGELDSPRKAFVPLIAAVGGVIAPALVFLAIAGSTDEAVGWPIPTATDIAFALGILAIVGKSLPARIRALLLALAVIDDLIAITLIAILFTADLNAVALLAAVPAILVFGFLARRLSTGSGSAPIVIAMIVLALVTWYLVHASGVHATIAGVALGLITPTSIGPAIKTKIEPWTNALVLPVFAFTASLVLLPQAGQGELEPVFWGVAIALPVGKLIGITVAALLATRLVPAAERKDAIPFRDILVVAMLGGIGFTVALLMNELAFRGAEEIAAQGTIGVLVGSGISIVLGLIVTASRARHYRRLTPVE